MKDGDPTPIFLGMAAVVVVIWVYGKNIESQTALLQCRNDFQSFKEGVLYGR